MEVVAQSDRPALGRLSCEPQRLPCTILERSLPGEHRGRVSLGGWETALRWFAMAWSFPLLVIRIVCDPTVLLCMHRLFSHTVLDIHLSSVCCLAVPQVQVPSSSSATFSGGGMMAGPYLTSSHPTTTAGMLCVGASAEQTFSAPRFGAPNRGQGSYAVPKIGVKDWGRGFERHRESCHFAPSTHWNDAPRYCSEDPINGCQTGTNCPVLHAK
jgi:hypothetical protein